MSETKVILLCSSRFALPTMQELVFFKQLAVVAVPLSNPEIVENVKVVLTGTGIPIIELEKKSFVKQLTDAIREYKVDLGLMMTFGYTLPASVFELPAKGFFNVHPGPLPAYRGADPVFQQIKNKEQQAGVTIHKLAEGLDTGPVVLLQMMRIDPTDPYGIVMSKLARLAADMVRLLLKLANYGLKIPSRAQDESKAVYFKKQKAADISIDWEGMDADTIVALVNACNPWNKGAVTKISNQIIRLVEAEKIATSSSSQKIAGQIISIDESGMIIAAINDQAIRVTLIYTEEGFFSLLRMKRPGLVPGGRFEKV
jgi:methionyl-tRNA formyltransferase